LQEPARAVVVAVERCLAHTETHQLSHIHTHTHTHTYTHTLTHTAAAAKTEDQLLKHVAALDAAALTATNAGACERERVCVCVCVSACL